MDQTREQLLEYQITEQTTTPEEAVSLILRYKAEIEQEVYERGFQAGRRDAFEESRTK